MAWVKSEIDALIRRNVMPQIQSNFATIKPLLWILVGRDKAELDKLGNPSTGLMFGGRNLMGEATRKVSQGDEEHEIPFQKAQTDAASTITFRGSVPTANGFAEDNFGTAAFRWSDYWTPFKFGQHSVKMTNNSQLRIMSIVEMSTAQAFQRLLEKIQSDLWTGTLTSAEQGNRLWGNLLGVEHQVSDGSTDSANFSEFGRVDRTVETELQANVKDIDTAVSDGDVPDTKVRLDLIRKAKIDYSLTDKFAGAGDFAITSPDLFSVLMEEAEDRHLRIIEGGMPEIGMEGFQLPMIKYGSTLITYDPDCPAGELYILTSRSWIFEVMQGANFQMEGNIHQKWDEEEGGGYYNWGNLHAACRLICKEPHLQFKYINLTADGS